MDDEFEGRTPARQFQRIDVLLLGLNFMSEVFGSLADTFESATMLVAAHANYNVERSQFHQDAAQEIERMTGDSDA